MNEIKAHVVTVGQRVVLPAVSELPEIEAVVTEAKISTSDPGFVHIDGRSSDGAARHRTYRIDRPITVLS